MPVQEVVNSTENINKNDSMKKSKQNKKSTSEKDNSSIDGSSSKGSYEVGACSLCHCCLDYSDRAAFFRSDREQDYGVNGINADSNKSKGSKSKSRLDGNFDSTSIQRDKISTENNGIPENGLASDDNNINKASSPEECTVEATKESSSNDAEPSKDEQKKQMLTLSRNESENVCETEDVNLTTDDNVNSKSSVDNNHRDPVQSSITTTANGNSESNGELKKVNSESNGELKEVTNDPKNQDFNAKSNEVVVPLANDIENELQETRIRQEDSDGDESSYYFRPTDPYLPDALYDPDNAVLYCDSCDRLFHQKCHFVPVLQVPKGDWNCLICTTGTTSKSRRKLGSSKKRTKTSTFVYDDDIFKSPPVESLRQQEIRWESDARVIAAKAELLEQWTSMSITKGNRDIGSRLKRYTRHQLQNARLAETALSTLTSTQQNRKHCYDAKKRKPSQELVQSILKFYTAKYRLKSQIHNIESIRAAAPQRKQWSLLLRWVQDYQAKNNNDTASDFIQRVIFPFGMKYERRLEPRTPEYDRIEIEDLCYNEQNNKSSSRLSGQIPNEIVLTTSNVEAFVPNKRPNNDRITKLDNSFTNDGEVCENKTDSKTEETGSINSNDTTPHGSSSFSLDRLTCSACLLRTTSDDNDLILCDGEGCFRAFHMNCVQPPVSKDDLEQEDSWFCPWCTAVAEWMHDVQVYWNGDDWEKRKLGYVKNANGEKSVSSSLKSWEDVKEVFPESDWEYESALKLKQGKVDDDTRKLLAQVLGLDLESNLDEEGDDDNLDVDGNFDLNSYEMRRKQEYDQLKKVYSDDESASDDNEVSSATHSSQATLVEMSSVELEIASDEIAALSEVDVSDSGSDNNSDHDNSDSNIERNHNRPSSAAPRRSKRIQRNVEFMTSSSKESVSQISENDPGKMDEKNIIHGKRNRKAVDYRRLNDAMFGDWDEEAVEMLDGGDDFGVNALAESAKRKEKPKRKSEGTSDGKGKEHSTRTSCVDTNSKSKKSITARVKRDASERRPRTSRYLHETKATEEPASASKKSCETPRTRGRSKEAKSEKTNGSNRNRMNRKTEVKPN